MAAYTLQLLISPTDLSTILQAGENIVLAKAFSDSPSNVAWVSCAPFQTNTISWDNSYGMYAVVSMASGKIQPQSTTSIGIASGMYYNFGPTPVFTGPFSGENAPPPGSFRVFNLMPPSNNPSFVFGLIQNVTANGVALNSSPTTAQVVPANQLATFTPLDTIYVWLQSGVAAGAVLSIPPLAGDSFAVSSRATKVDFTSASTLSYVYSSTTGAFVPVA